MDEKYGDHPKQAFDLYLYYTQANEPLPANSTGSRHIHHPKFGSFLKGKTDKLGLEVVLKLRKDYPSGDRDGLEAVADQVDWVLRHFAVTAKQADR